MKRGYFRIIALFLSVFMVFSLCIGCGKTPERGNDPDQDTVQTPDGGNTDDGNKNDGGNNDDDSGNNDDDGNNDGGGNNDDGGDDDGGGTKPDPEPTPKPDPEPSSDFTLPSAPNYGNGVSVHDPSVFYDEASATYYAFGSHFAVASSPDLMRWTQVTSDGTDGARRLYGTSNFRSVLVESDRLMGGDQNTWAPDVVKNGDKYYMYYSLTSGFGSNKSVIGRVEATSVMGPYSNEQIIVMSNGNNGEPNCIDPELYYDKNGGLWMVYGSFFAGIYVKELYSSGANFGLPKESGFGTLVWRGDGSGPEGPFVFYNAETDYYYLMVSYGDLSSTYNMRVARSKTPNGPFVDIKGNNVANVTGGGNKLAGNYQFSAEAKGYAALGHNSVAEKDGKFYCVYHTRYRQGTDGVTGNHNVQVNQIFFNEQGWPVLSPDRYAGESIGTVTKEDVAGNYDILVHTTGTSVTFAESTAYTLTADGKITIGTTTMGSWTLTAGKYVTLTLGGTAYRGVIAPAWNLYRGKGVLAITATSDTGGALWANGGASAPKSLTISDQTVTVREMVYGSVSDYQIAAFDASEGFSVSFWLSGATNVWHSPVLVAGALGVHLANLDAWNASGILNRTNRNAENSDLINGSYEQVFLYSQCFVTVTVTSSGIEYYKDGNLVVSYTSSRKMRYNNTGDSSSVTVGDFISELMAQIASNGCIFAWTGDGAGRIGAKNMILSSALSGTQARSLYTDYQNSGI